MREYMSGVWLWLTRSVGWAWRRETKERMYGAGWCGPRGEASILRRSRKLRAELTRRGSLSWSGYTGAARTRQTRSCATAPCWSGPPPWSAPTRGWGCSSASPRPSAAPPERACQREREREGKIVHPFFTQARTPWGESRRFTAAHEGRWAE
jgi:hypothetical protein